MTAYMRLEMPHYLLSSYADLAEAQGQYLAYYPGGKFPGFAHNFGLLSLNAAIVEGTLRSILHWYLYAEDETAKAHGMARGQTTPSLPERTLTRLRLQVDTSESWEPLKKTFAFVFGNPVAHYCPATVEDVGLLFVIRNSTAHGTSIQLPKAKLQAGDDEYLFKLQEQSTRLADYLTRRFGVSDVYEGLGHKDTAREFWQTTQDFFDGLRNLYAYPEPMQRGLDEIQNYSFGSSLWRKIP